MEASGLVQHHLGDQSGSSFFGPRAGGEGQLLRRVTLADTPGVQLVHAGGALHQGDAAVAVVALAQDGELAMARVADTPARDGVVEDGERGVGDGGGVKPLCHELSLLGHREVTSTGRCCHKER